MLSENQAVTKSDLLGMSRFSPIAKAQVDGEPYLVTVPEEINALAALIAAVVAVVLTNAFAPGGISSVVWLLIAAVPFGIVQLMIWTGWVWLVRVERIRRWVIEPALTPWSSRRDSTRWSLVKILLRHRRELQST
jgi:hypothetical protein